MVDPVCWCLDDGLWCRMVLMSFRLVWRTGLGTSYLLDFGGDVGITCLSWFGDHHHPWQSHAAACESMSSFMALASDGDLANGLACKWPDLANEPGMIDRLGLSRSIKLWSFSEWRMAKPWSLAMMQPLSWSYLPWLPRLITTPSLEWWNGWDDEIDEIIELVVLALGWAVPVGWCEADDPAVPECEAEIPSSLTWDGWGWVAVWCPEPESPTPREDPVCGLVVPAFDWAVPVGWHEAEDPAVPECEAEIPTSLMWGGWGWVAVCCPEPEWLMPCKDPVFGLLPMMVSAVAVSGMASTLGCEAEHPASLPWDGVRWVAGCCPEPMVSFTHLDPVLESVWPWLTALLECFPALLWLLW